MLTGKKISSIHKSTDRQKMLCVNEMQKTPGGLVHLRGFLFNLEYDMII